MSITVVGGNWDKNGGRPSSIVEKLAWNLFSEDIHNGGFIKDLPVKATGLTVWLPNIPNEVAKNYPKKEVGSCLIVSKVVRNEPGQHKYFEALQRIFKMRANAVIAIEHGASLFFKFSLIDALGNIWVSTSNLEKLADSILEFEEWSTGQVRHSVPKSKIDESCEYTDTAFLEVVKDNASRCVKGTDARYFGNCSTRCMATFPSSRDGMSIFVSARNINKEVISPEDMVLVTENGYCGSKKPSVDTPIQGALYEYFSNINYMIHGHAFFDNVPYTAQYVPCGDLREIKEVERSLPASVDFFVLNLKNHGFIVGSERLSWLDDFLKGNVPIMNPFRGL